MTRLPVLMYHAVDTVRSPLAVSPAVFARSMQTLAGAGWLCQCLFAVFQSLFTARQDYRRIAAISITGTSLAAKPHSAATAAGSKPIIAPDTYPLPVAASISVMLANEAERMASSR